MATESGSTNPHAARAQALLQLKRYAEAEAEIGLAPTIDPDSSRLFAWLAYCMQERGALREAKETALQAVGLGPDDGFAHYVLASVYGRKGDLERAIRSVLEALRLEPHDPYYH